MHVAAQTMSRMVSRWPVYLMIALGIAVVALAMLVSPTFAQEAAEATATAEPVNLAPIGAGIAILGIIGPGIGIGILGGMSASAIGRNPDAAGDIRGLAIILAAFAEGLGVLGIVVGFLLALGIGA